MINRYTELGQTYFLLLLQPSVNESPSLSSLSSLSLSLSCISYQIPFPSPQTPILKYLWYV